MKLGLGVCSLWSSSTCMAIDCLEPSQHFIWSLYILHHTYQTVGIPQTSIHPFAAMTAPCGVGSHIIIISTIFVDILTYPAPFVIVHHSSSRQCTVWLLCTWRYFNSGGKIWDLWAANVGIYWVHYYCIVLVGFSLFAYEKYKFHQAHSRQQSLTGQDNSYALDTLGIDSVYQFFIGKSKCGWTIVAITICTQF